MTGTVSTIVKERGFGFITADRDERGSATSFLPSIFWHRNDDLAEGDRVRFEIVSPTPPRGARAANVMLVETGSDSAASA